MGLVLYSTVTSCNMLYCYVIPTQCTMQVLENLGACVQLHVQLALRMGNKSHTVFSGEQYNAPTIIL